MKGLQSALLQGIDYPFETIVFIEELGSNNTHILWLHSL